MYLYIYIYLYVSDQSIYTGSKVCKLLFSNLMVCTIESFRIETEAAICMMKSATNAKMKKQTVFLWFN